MLPRPIAAWTVRIRRGSRRRCELRVAARGHIRDVRTGGHRHHPRWHCEGRRQAGRPGQAPKTVRKGLGPAMLARALPELLVAHELRPDGARRAGEVQLLSREVPQHHEADICRETLVYADACAASAARVAHAPAAADGGQDRRTRGWNVKMCRVGRALCPGRAGAMRLLVLRQERAHTSLLQQAGREGRKGVKCRC